MDVVVGGAAGPLVYMRNVGVPGRPTLSEVSGTESPLNGLAVGEGSAPTYGNLDGDGVPTLVVGDRSGALQTFPLSENSEMVGTPLPSGSSSPAAGDLDGDGNAVCR